MLVPSQKPWGTDQFILLHLNSQRYALGVVINMLAEMSSTAVETRKTPRPKAERMIPWYGKYLIHCCQLCGKGDFSPSSFTISILLPHF